MKHVILDTDIGGDPDDTFALLLCLASPEISLDLVVTSDEHKGHRAAFAKKLLAVLGKDILVVAGADLGNDRCCVVDNMVEAMAPMDYVAAIKTVVEKNEITDYLCISPQSNLAAFLQHHPGLMPKLRVTIMGGSINYRTEGKVEHNIRYDVAAARAVFAANIDKKYVLSETTFHPELRVDTNHDFYTRLHWHTSELDVRVLIKESIDNFFTHLYPSTLMHDPLTISVVIKPGFVTFAQKPLIMNERGEFIESSTGKITTVSTSAKYAEFMHFLGGRLPF